MHRFVVPEEALAYSKSIRGDDISTPLRPSRIAHLVIDMQNAFVAPGGIAELPVAREVTPNVNRISRAIREMGALNVFVREVYDPAWTAYWGRLRPNQHEEVRAALSRGAAQQALWPGLDVGPRDPVVNKLRFSPFVAGSSPLDVLLTGRGIDTIVVTGCMSNCCCESTIRDAVQLNYRAIFIHDANAAKSDEEHNATIANLVGVFGCEVCSTDEFLERAGRLTAERRPAVQHV